MPYTHAHELSAATISEYLAAAPRLPALDNTYGALFLGTAFGLMLYGLTVQQTYRYFRLYPTDRPILIWLVITVWLLESLHTVLIIEACYYHLITNHFDPLVLIESHWSTRLLTPTTGMTILVCQCFYVRRVWYIGPAFRYIVAISIILMFGTLGFTISATVEGFVLVSLSDFKHVTWMVSAVYGISILVDIVLTLSLIYVLLKSRTGLKRTDSTIEAIVLYATNTGLMNTIIGLSGFIFAIILPGNLIYAGISIVSVKVYANSVLAVLNSRWALSNRMLQGFEMDTIDARATRPHTNAETWDVPQLPNYGTHVSFAHPGTENLTTLDLDTAGTGMAVQFNLSGSGDGQKDSELQKALGIPL